MDPEEMRQSMSLMYGRSEPDQDDGRQSAKGPMVDRIEGQTAVLLHPDGSTSDVPVTQLPPGTKEGDYLGEHGGADRDSEARNIDALMSKLHQRSPDDLKDIKL